MRAALACTALLVAAGTLGVAGPAAATTPPVPPAPHADHPFAEGSSGYYSYDEDGSELHSLGKYYFYMTKYDPTADGFADFYYGTQNSQYFLNTGCDTNGATVYTKVLRGEFFSRIDSSYERDFQVKYDKVRDKGSYTARTFRHTDAYGNPDVCHPLT